MSNVWLFGPPGIGKSTIVRKVISSGKPGLDFETFWNGNQDLNWNRNNLMRIVKSLWQVGDIGAVYGAAGLDPKLTYPGKKVLLTLSQDEYEIRRAVRDRNQPAFRNQPKASVQAWEEMTKWDVVLKADRTAWKDVQTLLR